jgi:hypothetical protein
VDTIDVFVGKKAVDNNDIRYLKLDRLDAGRLEDEARVRSKIALLEGANEAVDIFAWVRNISDGVEGVGGRLRRRLVGFFIGEEPKDFPLHIWKLALEDFFTELRGDIEGFVPGKNSIDRIDRLSLAYCHIGHLGAHAGVLVYESELILGWQNESKPCII